MIGVEERLLRIWEMRVQKKSLVGKPKVKIPHGKSNCGCVKYIKLYVMSEHELNFTGTEEDPTADSENI